MPRLAHTPEKILDTFDQRTGVSDGRKGRRIARQFRFRRRCRRLPTGHHLANPLDQAPILLNNLHQGLFPHGNNQQLRRSQHRGRTRLTGQERHLAEKFPRFKRRHCRSKTSLLQANIGLSGNNDIEYLAWLALADDSLTGQIVLIAIGALFAGAMWGLVLLGRPAATPRLLSGIERRAS